jgi:hypothetical protein
MNLVADKIEVWMSAALVGLLTIFSDRILGRIRLRLNRADLRTKYFEELAVDLSAYLFYAEMFHERYRRGWTDDPNDLDAVGSEVNEAVTTLRKKEYVYRFWAKKYWGREPAIALVEVLEAVKTTDDAIHLFNDDGNQEEKIVLLGQRLAELRTKVERWLSQSDA